MSPPVMSLTFFAKSSAYSWKMSFCGQVLCQRIEIGPWALATIGKPSAAAPVAARVAPCRNLRRGVSVAIGDWLMKYLLRIDEEECSAVAGKSTAGKLAPWSDHRPQAMRAVLNLSTNLRWRGFLGAAGRPEGYGQPASAPSEREPERGLQADVGQRLPHFVAREHHALADLEDDVTHLKPGPVGRAPRNDHRNGRDGHHGECAGPRGLGLPHDEAELGADPLTDDRAGHRHQLHIEAPASLRPQDRQPHIPAGTSRGDEPLQEARLGYRPVLECDHQVAALQAGLLGRRSLHDVDDEHTETLAEAVPLRDLVAFLLGQVADTHAEPRPLRRVDRRSRRRDQQ